jgi:hypothetical protein
MNKSSLLSRVSLWYVESMCVLEYYYEYSMYDRFFRVVSAILEKPLEGVRWWQQDISCHKYLQAREPTTSKESSHRTLSRELLSNIDDKRYVQYHDTPRGFSLIQPEQQGGQ